MSDNTPEGQELGMNKEDSIFHIAFAWLAALSTSIAAWFGLS